MTRDTPERKGAPRRCSGRLPGSSLGNSGARRRNEAASTSSREPTPRAATRKAPRPPGWARRTSGRRRRCEGQTPMSDDRAPNAAVSAWRRCAPTSRVSSGSNTRRLSRRSNKGGLKRNDSPRRGVSPSTCPALTEFRSSISYRPAPVPPTRRIRLQPPPRPPRRPRRWPGTVPSRPSRRLSSRREAAKSLKSQTYRCHFASPSRRRACVRPRRKPAGTEERPSPRM